MFCFRINGRVIDPRTKKGLSALRVEAWDKDMICNDLVGCTTTDRHGTFQLDFDESYFRELFLDRRPDLFFKVFQDNQLLTSTEESVLWNLTAGETELVIEIEQFLIEPIKVVIAAGKEAEIEYPEGFYITIGKDVFDRDSTVEIGKSSTRSLAHIKNAFRVSSTVTSDKTVEVSIRLEYKPSPTNPPDGDVVPFVEIEEGENSFLIAGRLKKRLVDDRTEYCVNIRHTLFKEKSVDIGGEVIIPVNKIKPVFHPVQHHIKISETMMDRYKSRADGSTCNDNESEECCRRKDSDSEVIRRRDGSEDEVIVWCRNPRSQNLYPACYPAAWANLCSSYQMTPLYPHRHWELGTPDETNPPPNEFGDFFSTWAMGTFNIGEAPPVSRVEDWQADISNPTPIKYEIHQQEFRLEEGELDEGKISRRAALIRNYLLRVVGGVDLGILAGLRPPRPVLVRHSGHAWNIVGVETQGFWSHAQNPTAAHFSDWCLWEQAPWQTDDLHKNYWIAYPKDCSLKPEERRFGCINFLGSGDNFPRILFKDVNYRPYYDILDVNGDPVTTVNWTPHTCSEMAGYFWIEGNVPLTQRGLPELRHEKVWDPRFGRDIPQPALNFGDCPCEIPDGCHLCRLRLMLPFWVHNTTLDKLVTYRISLLFWSKDRRWVSLEANSIQLEDGKYHGFESIPMDIYENLPGPLPGENFSIQAKPDSNDTPGRYHPINSEPIAWYVDFRKDQLLPGSIQGIRMVLTCVEVDEEPISLVQDVKQLWFRVVSPPG